MDKNSKSNQNNTKSEAPTIVWLRHDLRLVDQPALYEASQRGGPVVPVFVWAPQEEAPWAPGAASQVWLYFSLKKLDEQLQALDSKLFFFEGHGGTLPILQNLAETLGAGAIFWNRRYEPVVIERDKKIKEELKATGLEVESFNGSLLFEPWQVQTKEGKPYQVFTPFWRACRSQFEAQLEKEHGLPLPKPRALSLPADIEKTLKTPKQKKLHAVTLEDLDLLPKIHWDKGIRESWEPGEKGAIKQLDKFLDGALADYREGRDQPSIEGVSRLSPHLHFGEISPRSVWMAVSQKCQSHKHNAKLKEAGQSYLRELGWREFSHHILFHFPHTTDAPLRPAFSEFPWSKNKEGFKAWSKGLTGYPIVDAGMRELWHTGIMHNRVRMIVASFLVKDLLVPWQDGAHWFWDTLVDADLAQNSLGWQWTAGCGADAAPYFRIFNPLLQGEKFDPDGEYVKRWVPELKRMPKKFIHKPWLAPPLELQAAGITLGETYPQPIIDHGFARDRALTAFKQLSSRKI